MANAHVFKDTTIDEDVHEQSLQYTPDDSKGNPISKGVVSLEKLYDLENHFKGPKNTKPKIPHRCMNRSTREQKEIQSL